MIIIRAIFNIGNILTVGKRSENRHYFYLHIQANTT